MKILVDYNQTTGYITLPNGGMYLAAVGLVMEEFKEEEEEAKESKLTVQDIIDLKRANVI